MTTGQLVFVIDDDEAVRDSMGMLLESADLDYECFASADDFLAQYDDDRRGCLVLDIRMPGMTGLELQQKLGAVNSVLPIIFLTGHGDVPMAVEAASRSTKAISSTGFSSHSISNRATGTKNRTARWHVNASPR